MYAVWKASAFSLSSGSSFPLIMIVLHLSRILSGAPFITSRKRLSLGSSVSWMESCVPQYEVIGRSIYDPYLFPFLVTLHRNSNYSPFPRIILSIKWNELQLLEIKSSLSLNSPIKTSRSPTVAFNTLIETLKAGNSLACFQKTETHLEFVGRVEGNFSHFLVPCSNIHDVTQNNFCKFQQSCFGGITHHNSLYGWEKGQLIAHLHLFQGILRASIRCWVLEQQW